MEEYGYYTDLKLTVASAIPDKSTIILLDRRDDSYWYYRANGAVGSVPLTAFIKMGESGTYSIPEPAQPNGYVDLSYQFVVDFSQTSGGYTGTDPLNMALEATIKTDETTGKSLAGVPEVKPEVTVSMAESSFEFKKESENGLTCTLNCIFNVTGGAAASKWENRASALVLTPEESLPPDARIKAVVDGRTTYLYKSGGSFIVPMSLLKDESTVTLTLESALFPAVETSYDFTAQWRISPSKAGKAPMTGDSVGITAPQTALHVTFTSPVKKTPSLKITGTDRVLTVGATLKVNVRYQDLDGDKHTISAALQRKGDDGTYNGTGWNQMSVNIGELGVPLGGQNPGSYCLMLTVKEKDSVTTVMQVPYYFVINQT